MTATTNPTADLDAALDALRAAVETAAALAPLRRLLVDVDEQLRAAARQCRAAGMSERGIAAHAEVSQPTVREWTDGRQSDPLPSPSLAEQLWVLHRIANVLATLTLRATADPDLPDTAPTSGHSDPGRCVRAAHDDLDQVADLLGRAAAATEYTARTQ